MIIQHRVCIKLTVNVMLKKYPLCGAIILLNNAEISGPTSVLVLEKYHSEPEMYQGCRRFGGLYSM